LHTFTSINFLLPAYFAFFIGSKTDNQLKFQQYSAPVHLTTHTAVELFVARHMTSSEHSSDSTCGSLTSQTLIVSITES